MTNTKTDPLFVLTPNGGVAKISRKELKDQLYNYRPGTIVINNESDTMELVDGSIVKKDRDE